MRRLYVAVLLLTVSSTAPGAQEAVTRAQRDADLEMTASLYAKNYGPYEWKRDVLGFDLMRLTPWLQRIHHSDDLDFQEALIEYVASLNDAHDTIAFPTTFSASLPMSVDIYDGKVLIDAINRTLLPLAQFPFGIGDEIVSLDGRPVQQLIQSFRKYADRGQPAQHRSHRGEPAGQPAASRSCRTSLSLATPRRSAFDMAATGATHRLHDSLDQERHPDSVAGAGAESPSAATGACSSRPTARASSRARGRALRHLRCSRSPTWPRRRHAAGVHGSDPRRCSTSACRRTTTRF